MKDENLAIKNHRFPEPQEDEDRDGRQDHDNQGPHRFWKVRNRSSNPLVRPEQIPGAHHVRDGSKQASVSIRTSEGDELERRRNTSGAVNEYLFNGFKYKSFGNSVPSDIANKLLISDINFQDQHDAPFWFNETAGELSRRLNAVIDLSVIDKSIGYISSVVREAQSTTTIRKEGLEQAREEQEGLEDERVRVEEFREIETMHKKCKSLKDEIAPLKELISQIANNRASKLKQKAEEGEHLIESGRKWRRTKRQIQELKGIVSEISECQKILESSAPDFTELESAYNKWCHLLDDCRNLSMVVEKAENEVTILKEKKQEMERAEKQFHNAVHGAICPLCKQKIQ